MRKLFFVTALICTQLLSACDDGAKNASDPLNCEISGDSYGIIGGRPLATGNQLSHSTVLVVDNGASDTNQSYLCTGTLIAPNLVLTAAHCISPDSAEAYIGFSNNVACVAAARERTLRKVTGFRIHPQYIEKSPENDLAIIRFEGALPNGYTTRRLHFQTPQKAQHLVLTGYGLTRESDPGDGKLRYATLSMQALSRSFMMPSPWGTGFELKVNYSKAWVIDQTRGVGICSGDSGGPLYVQTPQGLELIGVASVVRDHLTASESRICSGVGMYTDVTSHEDWIRKAAHQLQRNN